MKKTFVAVAIFAAMMGNVQAQGIPVVDAAALAQQVQQVAAWAQQLQEMANQYEQLRAQVKAATGNKDIAGLLNSPAIKSAVPEGWMEEYKAITTVAEAQKATGAFIQNAMGTAHQRASAIQQMVVLIDQMPDAKASADLQNRIAGEQALLQNEKIMIDLAKEQRINQRDFMIQEKRKAGKARLFGD